jgi:hypothetical protein
MSRIVLTHASRHVWSRLTFDVRQKKMRTQIILLSTAGVLGLVFAIFRPAPNTAPFWLIVASGVFCVIYNSIIENRRRKQEVAKYKIWHARLMELVDIDDFENDGHLNEWFTDAQWTEIFKELESMPKGSRSLKQAIETVVPEIKNEA